MNKTAIVILILVALVNLATFFAYGIDKQKAKNNSWRIPEKTLVLMALFFGGFGAFSGMHFFRHKTKHPKFYLLIPIFTIVQFIILILVFKSLLY